MSFHRNEKHRSKGASLSTRSHRQSEKEIGETPTVSIRQFLSYEEERARARAVLNYFPAQRERARGKVSTKRGSKARGFSVVAMAIGIV